MGWIKLAVASALGIYSYRSVARVNHVVKAVHIPTHTLHANHQGTHKLYKDAFKIQLPDRYKLVKGIGSSEEVVVTDLARSFFSCPVFTYLERPILEFLLRDRNKNELEIINKNKFRFNVGDEFLAWSVIEKKHNEILLKWEYGQLKGTTWFYVPYDENCLVFGSSFQSPNSLESPRMKDFMYNSPKQLFIDGSRNLPDPIPLGVKLRNFALKTVFRISVPLHVLYSKYLLESAQQRLISVKK